MFIIDLHYIVPLEQLDAHMPEHVAFLRKYYAQNVFVASGRKVPRTGGIILALASSKEDVEAIMAEDPFTLHGLAKITITEFLTSQYHPDLKRLVSSSKK
ncbi:YciI family protein [Chryseolinea lacunae]|uniref:GTP cyclohydrolase n=1 Tax=Chryseolinea lacunae TaxID=2801331 RepID=A0ABS1KMY5_9BACT|nr:YciI family protein [Chryseolinea lacunae]MBL0740820.1 GTP cyclohydrolase [Chryseolinea lacunae]